MQEHLDFGEVGLAITNPYHARDLSPAEFFSPLPTSASARRHNTQWMRPCVMRGYNGLELVVYGAVELGDVVLFFVGEQGLFGLEVYTRLAGQTDGVCDCGILATGLH